MLVPQDNARAIGAAMHEIFLACNDLTITDSEQAESWRSRLMEWIERGEGSWEEKAAAMSQEEQSDFADTTWELWAWAHRR